MKHLTQIICLIACFQAISCTETPDCREFQVPEIVSITSLPEIHSAVLISDLKDMPSYGLEAGFYIGRDRSDLQCIKAGLSEKRFLTEITGLDENTTYYFKAYVTNGLNEIASGFGSFTTGSEPVIPDEPGNSDEPQEPSEPDTPEEPEIPEKPDQPDEPEIPEKPDQPDEPEEPVEFTVSLISVVANYSNDALELIAQLDGDSSLITECWFMVGRDSEKMSRIKGATEGNTVKAYLMGLDEGTYYYKAVISNGVETKESETCQINIYRN